MTNTGNPIIVIPARLASTRLPDKPLADIVGQPMIVHVWRRGKEAGIGPVIVAAADKPIRDAVVTAGGDAMLTDPDLPSGSDRTAQLLERFDPERQFDIVVSLQGDLPTIDPHSVARCLEPLAEPAVDIASLVAVVDDPEEKADPSVVKAIAEFGPGETIARAHDFSRLLPEDHQGPHLHHIGIYAYRRTALEAFVRLPPSPRENLNRLEQLRALDAGMRIDVVRVDTVPLGVDTPADLERARAILTGT